MFPIQDCSRSIGIHVLLAIAFGITEYLVSGNSIHANESCENLHGEMICYFKGSNETMDWYRAKQLCSSFNSTLPVIRDENDQNALADYLRTHLRNVQAWTAGTNYTHSNWTWINGNSLKDFGKVELQEIERSDYGALGENFKFTAHTVVEEMPFICQYLAADCQFHGDISAADKCFLPINDNRKWYDARNHCLMDKGDLAIVDHMELDFTKEFKLNQSYWIGLRKKSFRWTLNDDVESNDEIKYTNWDNLFATDGECISIESSKGTWTAHGCNELRTVVCQSGQGVTSPTTTTDASAETIHTFTQERTTVTDGSQSSTQFLFAVVGVGIVIVICIIVIVVFVLRTRNGRSGQSKLDDGYAKNNGEELNTRISHAPAYTSINESANAPVSRSDDIQGVYADIPLLTSEQSDDGGTNQQPGIFYASLDFNKDPTKQEPNQTFAHSTSSPTKVGPLGDIYAIPDAKGHAVTSPGDGSASHPIKVTPQGDVYAIPMKISTSPTVNPPIGAVYANLPTATLSKEQMAVESDEKSNVND